MRTTNKKSGFSLIEIVIYTAILAALSLFVANTTLLSFNSLNRARLNRKVALSAETALERLTREIKLASSINEAQSVLGTNPSTVVLNTVVSAEDITPASKIFSVSGGQITLQENGGEIKFLTAPGITVSSFTASGIDLLHSKAIKINLVIESGGGSIRTSKTFYASAVLRESY